MDEWKILWAKSDSTAVFNFIFFWAVGRKGREAEGEFVKPKNKNKNKIFDEKTGWLKVNAVGEKKLLWNFSRYGGGGNWNIIQIV